MRGVGRLEGHWEGLQRVARGRMVHRGKGLKVGKGRKGW